MARIAIGPISSGRAAAAAPSFSQLLFLIAGVYSLLLPAGALEWLAYGRGMLLAFAAALCLALWAALRLGRRWGACAFGAGALLWGAALLALWDQVWAQLSQIAGILLGTAAEEVIPAGWTALLFTAAAVLLLFALEFLLHLHVAACFFTAVPALLGPMVGLRPTVASIACMALFQFSFLSVHLVGLRPRRASFSPAERGRLAAVSGRLTAAVLAAAVLIALPAAARHVDGLWQSIYEAEGFFLGAVRQLSGEAEQPVSGGDVSRGTNYRTGTEQLRLYASRKPTETLYLRGFSGGEYVGGDWIPADDEAVFAQIAGGEAGQAWLRTPNELGQRLLTSQMLRIYYSMYFVLNSIVQWGEEDPAPIALSVQHSSDTYETRYVPYYSASSREWNGTGGYGFLYYEQDDVNVDWDAMPPELGAYWYRWVQNVYEEAIQEAYTAVPRGLLPRLAALCEEHPLEGLEDITAFILYTLHSQASYTLTPGWFPANEDVVEAFLFDVGCGYCEHFAAAGTLMYRLYGIPARYAAGYAVAPEEFVLQEDGTWLASVTDESAHAWVEIFLDNYGWTPVEVTPAADGSSAASYPGFDSGLLSELTAEHGWALEASASVSGIGGEAAEAGDAAETRLFPGLSIDWAEHRDLLLVLAACGIYTLCLAPLLLEFRRLRHLRRLERAGCRSIFVRLLELLRFAGLPEGYDGLEEDFPAQAAAVLSCVKAEDLARLQRIVSAAAFGPDAPSLEEEGFAWQLYSQAAQDVQRRLSWRKKLLFRYWHTFG